LGGTWSLGGGDGKHTQAQSENLHSGQYLSAGQTE
jgi:hypothetical protein